MSELTRNERSEEEKKEEQEKELIATSSSSIHISSSASSSSSSSPSSPSSLSSSSSPSIPPSTATTSSATPHVESESTASFSDSSSDSSSSDSSSSDSSSSDSSSSSSSFSSSSDSLSSNSSPSSSSSIDKFQSLLTSANLPPSFKQVIDLLSSYSSSSPPRVVVLCGAGISVSCGIPDFRSPKTGLYAQLGKYGIENATDIFDLEFFRENPLPFYALAREIYPSSRFLPSLSHFFFKLLDQKGLLSMVFSQNIDGLELQVGLPTEKIIQCHGNFFSATCIHCNQKKPIKELKTEMFAGNTPICSSCRGFVKPDIVFFGEQLPRKFFNNFPLVREADILLVMGTSLAVEPFASLIGQQKTKKNGNSTFRLLINKERAGEKGRKDIIKIKRLIRQLKRNVEQSKQKRKEEGKTAESEEEISNKQRIVQYERYLQQLEEEDFGFDFRNLYQSSTEGEQEEKDSQRDFFFEGDCDEQVRLLCRLLGWEEELDELIKAGPKASAEIEDALLSQEELERWNKSLAEKQLGDVRNAEANAIIAAQGVAKELEREKEGRQDQRQDDLTEELLESFSNL